MPKVVVYVQADDAKRLEADGKDPAEWVRELVRHALAKRVRTVPDRPSSGSLDGND